ncbi:hypothetical protein IE53DRAFT_370090 [Violaceomyces palustris]|uniref:Uncharacterized protein n=1 Tax=Violaceomyces palustris TaxID=1673888 RepID=A0ACD0NTD6_9BASI|nr:hypothetical protein IE53DRAFT_370090 [Violaceomyces palustris]
MSPTASASSAASTGLAQVGAPTSPSMNAASPRPANVSAPGPGASTASPRLVTALGRDSSPKPGAKAIESGVAQGRASPGLRNASLGTSLRAGSPANASRAPWANMKPSAAVTSGASSANGGSVLSDFPTAAEAARAKQEQEERAAALAAQEAARQQQVMQGLDRFRGTSLGAGNHWDEMEDEDGGFLDEVVEFADGTQYKISHNHEEDSGAKANDERDSAPVSKEERFKDVSHDRSWPPKGSGQPQRDIDMSKGGQGKDAPPHAVLSAGGESGEQPSKAQTNTRQSAPHKPEKVIIPAAAASVSLRSPTEPRELAFSRDRRPGAYPSSTYRSEAPQAPKVQATVSSARAWGPLAKREASLNPQTVSATSPSVPAASTITRGGFSSTAPSAAPAVFDPSRPLPTTGPGGRPLPPHLAAGITPSTESLNGRPEGRRTSFNSPPLETRPLPPHQPSHPPVRAGWNKPSETSHQVASEAMARSIDSQESEMLSAVERARKRRQEEEEARLAEKERARQKALALEEKIKAEKAEKARKEEEKKKEEEKQKEARRLEEEAEKARAEAERKNASNWHKELPKPNPGQGHRGRWGAPSSEPAGSRSGPDRSWNSERGPRGTLGEQQTAVLQASGIDATRTDVWRPKSWRERHVESVDQVGDSSAADRTIASSESISPGQTRPPLSATNGPGSRVDQESLVHVAGKTNMRRIETTQRQPPPHASTQSAGDGAVSWRKPKNIEVSSPSPQVSELKGASDRPTPLNLGPEQHPPSRSPLAQQRHVRPIPDGRHVEPTISHLDDVMSRIKGAMSAAGQQGAVGPRSPEMPKQLYDPVMNTTTTATSSNRTEAERKSLVATSQGLSQANTTEQADGDVTSLKSAEQKSPRIARETVRIQKRPSGNESEKTNFTSTAAASANVKAKSSPSLSQPAKPSLPPPPKEPWTTRVEVTMDKAPVWSRYTVNIKASSGKAKLSKPQQKMLAARVASMNAPSRNVYPLTWDPPITTLAMKTLSRDDQFFPKKYNRGTVIAPVGIPTKILPRGLPARIFAPPTSADTSKAGGRKQARFDLPAHSTEVEDVFPTSSNGPTLPLTEPLAEASPASISNVGGFEVKVNVPKSQSNIPKINVRLPPVASQAPVSGQEAELISYKRANGPLDAPNFDAVAPADAPRAPAAMRARGSSGNAGTPRDNVFRSVDALHAQPHGTTSTKPEVRSSFKAAISAAAAQSSLGPLDAGARGFEAESHGSSQLMSTSMNGPGPRHRNRRDSSNAAAVAFHREDRSISTPSPVSFMVTSEIQKDAGLGSGVANSSLNFPVSSTTRSSSNQTPGSNSSVLPSPSLSTSATWGQNSLTFPVLETRAQNAPDRDHIKSVWSLPAGHNDRETQNSLKGIADDFLPSTIPLSLHDLKNDDQHMTGASDRGESGNQGSKLRVYAPFDKAGEKEMPSLSSSHSAGFETADGRHSTVGSSSSMQSRQLPPHQAQTQDHGRENSQHHQQHHHHNHHHNHSHNQHQHQHQPQQHHHQHQTHQAQRGANAFSPPQHQVMPSSLQPFGEAPGAHYQSQDRASLMGGSSRQSLGAYGYGVNPAAQVGPNPGYQVYSGAAAGAGARPPSFVPYGNQNAHAHHPHQHQMSARSAPGSPYKSLGRPSAYSPFGGPAASGQRSTSGGSTTAAGQDNSSAIGSGRNTNSGGMHQPFSVGQSDPRQSSWHTSGTAGPTQAQSYQSRQHSAYGHQQQNPTSQHMQLAQGNAQMSGQPQQQYAQQMGVFTGPYSAYDPTSRVW